MAISIITSAHTVEYAYTPYYFRFTSTNSGKLNFKYVVDLYADHSNPSAYPPVIRVRLPVRPDNTGLFTPMRILESYVSPQFYPASSALTDSYPAYIIYNMKVGEEYDNSVVLSAATGTTIYSALTNTGNFYAINATRQYDQAYDLTDHMWNGSNYPTFWTDWPQAYPKRIRRQEWSTLGNFSLFNSNSYVVTTRDVSGNPVGQYVISNGWNANSLCHTYGTGTNNLNYSGYNLISSAVTSQIIGNNIHSYTIYSSNSGTDQRTLEFTYWIDDSCHSVYGYQNVFWQNKYGSFDNWNFELMKRESFSVKDIQWEKKLAYNYSKGDLSKSVLAVQSQKKIQLSTGHLSDIEASFLINLLERRQCYFVADDGSYVPAIVTTPDLELSQIVNNKLNNYTLDFAYGFSRNIQRT